MSVKLPQLSLIIPVFNEEKIATFYLEKLKLNENLEISVVDGGSGDRMVEICRKFTVKVLNSPQKGRANQMNFGASQAQGEILLFLHLDSELPTDYLTEIKRVLSEPNIIAGAFRFKVDTKSLIFRFLEYFVNGRSRLLGLPYGDQGFFIKAEKFWQLGGFKNLPIMEDYEFVQRVKQEGKIGIANSSVKTSARRWQKL
ncbi:MAG: TIGR04283 family arsenosugar biosynthesis glycosyltransferase, partial [Microcystaceae cyanobacterium]